MHLADHIRPLLRDHDCVIIPDFGGLVAEPVPAHLSAARQQLGPPAKQVAFNQALTRNDGLLVDALSQYLRITANQAREVLRHAVEDMHQDLRANQRTELPGIGVFRQSPGRGLSFDYTGTDNLLPTAFGLPALNVRPVLATDARLAREKRPALLQPAPRLRAAAQRRFSRLFKGVGIGMAATILVGASYMLSLNAGLVPAAWRFQLPQWTAASQAVAPAGRTLTLARALEPQQATLAHDNWSSNAGQVTPVSELTVAEATPTSTDFKTTTSAAQQEVPADAWAAVPAENVRETAGETTTKMTGPVAAKPAIAPLAAATVAKAKKKNVAPAPAAGVVSKAAVSSVAKAKVLPSRKVAWVPAASATTIKLPSGRSYVIASTFATQASADAYRSRLARVGFTNSKVIPAHPGTRKFRVSVADYADLASARTAAAQMRYKRKIFFDVYSY
jgi:hypothetical protein